MHVLNELLQARLIVLDIVHVIEKLWAASRCFHTATDPAAETWVGNKAARILAGDASDAVGDIRADADHLGLSADQRGAADRACRYLENNTDYIQLLGIPRQKGT
ncbi:hypothetical protein ACH4SK_39300 [Streptomyces inhibens]|uniref:hypothetical protein n=1 Tax=Streptomyces inhibens TaxID=2293571 RepID=UPI0037A7DDC8